MRLLCEALQRTGYNITKVLSRPAIRRMISSESFKNLATTKPMVGLVQMTSTADKESTFLQLSALVERAKIRGAQVIFLPECSDYISESKSQAIELAETIDGDLVQRYKNLAEKLDIWLSIGGFHEKPVTTEKVEQIFNTHLIIDNKGQIQGKYRKVHMFDVDVPGGVPMHESAYCKAGTTLGPPVDTPVGKVGMAICYDLRFPELSISLREQGADILTFPSAFTVPTGMAHWQVLLRSRAIENQCYVIAAAQVGRHHAKRSSYGHAMVVDPWGTIVAECHDKPDVSVVEIDLDLMRKHRIEMPVFNHRRHDIYGKISTHQTNASIDSEVHYPFAEHFIKSSCVFYKTALSYAFVNRKPVLPGHALVCSLRPAERFTDLTPAELHDVFSSVQRISRAIEKHYNSSSLTIAIQDGPEAGQTVKVCDVRHNWLKISNNQADFWQTYREHLHVHILPRRKEDFESVDDIYDKLEKHDRNFDVSKFRSEEDMAAEAKELRKYFSD